MDNQNLYIQEVLDNENPNVLELSVASEKPYLKEDAKGNAYYEVLVVSEDAIDGERLEDGKCPFLFEHDAEKQIGVVEKAFISEGKLKVVVRFSENEFAQEILKDIRSGIRRNVSIGYMITEHTVKAGADFPTVYAVKWMPYECSTCSVPADSDVGYKRNLKENNNMKKSKKEEIQEDTKPEETPVEETPAETPKAEETPVKTEAPVEEEKGCGGKKEEKVEEAVAPPEAEDDDEEEVDEYAEVAEEIKAAGELADDEELASECINNKKSLADFKVMLKEKRNINNSNNKIKENKPMEKFSISKAIRNNCSKYVKDNDVSQDIETKVNEANKREFNVGSEYDIVIKNENLRALGPSAGFGNELINAQYLPNEYTPALRPQNTLSQTGYRTIPVNGGPISFAQVISGTTAAMYDLDGALSDGDMQFVTKEMKAKKAGACVPIPYSMLLQAKPEIDAIVEDDIVLALDELKVKMALVGDGTGNNPTGITATSGINTMTPPSSAFTWNGVCTMEKKVRDSNDFGTLSFVMNSTNKCKFETTLKDSTTGYGGFICENNKIKDIPVYVNNALDDNTIILGNFGELLIAEFDGLMMKVDDISLIKKGAIQVIATEAFDVLVRRPKSFCITKLA